MTTQNGSSGLVRTMKIQGLSMVLAFLSLTVAGVSISQSYNAQKHTSSLATCRQHAADNAAVATAIRAKIATDQNTLIEAQIKADNDFIVRLISAPVSDSEGKVIIKNFLATNKILISQQQMLNQEREDNPVPLPPNVICS